MSMFFLRRTPFATGPEDDTNRILTRINDGNISLTGGTWEGVTDLAKVCHAILISRTMFFHFVSTPLIMHVLKRDPLHPNRNQS